MKTYTALLLLIFALSTGIINAQNNKTYIGVEAGPGITFIRGNEIIDQYHKSKIGFSGGISFLYKCKKNISFKTALAFERKGSKTKEEVFDNLGNSQGIVTIKHNYDYLTLPLLAKASFGNIIPFFVNAGPYIGYLIKQTNSGKGENIRMKEDRTSQHKRFDIGLSLGAGFTIPIKQSCSFDLEVRNNLGLYNTSKIPVINDGFIKMNSTNLLIGLTYRLGTIKK